MPGIYDEDKFVNTKPTHMRGRLRELIDDVENNYGGLQKKYLFYDVEVLETNSSEPLELKDDEFIAYCNQSTKPNSKDRAVTAAWNEFAREHFGESGGYRMSRFNDVLVEYRESEVLEGGTNSKTGEEISPAVFLVPVALVEEGTTRGKKQTVSKSETQVDEDAADASEETPEIDPRLITKAVGLIGEDGTTVSVLTREMGKTVAAKKALEAAGGLKALLAHMTEQELVTVEGQAVHPFVPSAPDEESDEPF